MNRIVRGLAMGLAALIVVGVAVVWYARRSTTAQPATYVASDGSLHAPYFFLYPSRAAAPPRAIVVLFGNDIAFWVALHVPPPRLSGVLALISRAMRFLIDSAPAGRS